MFFSVTKGIQSINWGGMLSAGYQCILSWLTETQSQYSTNWQMTVHWKLKTPTHSCVLASICDVHSLLVKRVRLLFNSPRKSHSYTRHVKWGSEGREGGCRVEGNQEGHSYSIIVSYEVMLELEHRDHTFTSWLGGHNHNVQTHRSSSGYWWQCTFFPILADFTTSY